MLKFVIGPVLLGAGYLAGSLYGSDVEQIVHKSPSDTYSVTVSVKGASLRGAARVFSYGKDDTSIRTSSKPVRGPSFALRLAPYSLTTVQLPCDAD